MRLATSNPPRVAKWLAVSLISLMLGLLTPQPGHAQAVTTTTVQGTVYNASGAPASGIVQLSWPAFTTNAGQAVAAGRTTVTIGADGFLSVNLAPNAGAAPAGLYYTAVYHLNDGTTSTEYWTVPAAPQATIAQIRAQVLPAAQAVQAASKSYVDNAIQSLTKGSLASNGGALSGPLYLNGDPTAPTQAADKHYVDAQFAQALPLSGGTATGPLSASQLGAVYQVDQFPGSDFGAKLQACVSNLSSASGGVCDARNFASTLTIASNVTIATPNAAIYLPCSTITTAKQVIVPAGTRNVAIHGCAYQGGSTANGTQGGTVWVYTGSSNAFQIGDMTGAVNTPGFWMHDLNLNTANAGTSATGIYFKRAQELRLDGVYLNGNNSTGQTGIVLDGTGNYAGGTFIDVYINAFGTGWQLTGDIAGNYANASTFIKTHVVCPTSGGNPIAGTTGINLLEGDGNTFSGGDVESCATMFHLGASAINNTVLGLRNENSTIQFQADAGSSFNSVLTGGTLYTGKLIDNGSRNSFSDAFHRASNGIKGDWYASQQDATVTNHQRLGTGTGNERGMLNEIQTDYGNRWLEGFSDAMGTGYQIWQLQDLVNNVNRFSIGQYLSGSANVVTNVVLNNGGCYTSTTPPTVTFSGGGGTGASGTAVMTTTANPNCNSGAGYQVGSITMTSGGSGYTSAPTVTFAGSNQVTAPNPTAEIVTSGGTNNQTVINAAGAGAIVLNGSNNAGTGGVVIGSGGTANTTVATINGAGNAQFVGTLQVGGASQSGGTMSVKNNADAEVDYYLQPGATSSQKGSFVYKDFNGASQWYMVKDQNNNWSLNSAVGGLDSFKAYQSNNSGDTYINASNTGGHIRLNYESGSGTETDIYSNGSLDASFLGPTSIKFPGIAADSSGSHYCLQVDSSGYVTNTGGACVTAAVGSTGQIASYSSSGAVTGISTVPVASGGTGATTTASALANLGAQAAMPGVASDGSSGLAVTGNIAAATAVANQIASEYYASGYRASGSNTALDNFWSAILANTPANGALGHASGVLPPGASTANNGFSLTPPASSGVPTLALMLRGAGSGFYGLDTAITAGSSVTAPLLNFPPLNGTSTATSHWLDPHLSGFTLNLNGRAQECLAGNAWLGGTISDVSCINSTVGASQVGTSTYNESWIKFGDTFSSIGGTCPSGYNCAGENVFADNVLAWSGSNAGPADLSLTLSSGTLTGITVSSYDSSKHYVNGSPINVIFKCAGGNETCYTASPAAYATMTSDGSGLYTVSSVTVTGAGTGITSALTAVLPDLPAAAYGITTLVSDSTFKDLQIGSVGQTAGLNTRGTVASLFLHPHPWGQPVGISDWGYGDHYLYPEIDSVTKNGFWFLNGGGLGAVVDSPNFIYPADTGSGIFSNVADYRFSATAPNITIMNQLCDNGNNPNSGYVQFLKAGSIATDVGYGWYDPSMSGIANSTYALPPRFTVFNAHPCKADPTPASGVFVESRGLDSTDPNRVMTFTAGNTNASAIGTPFLIAEIPPSSLGAFVHGSATFTLTAGQYNGNMGRLVTTISNGASPIFSTTASGAIDLSSTPYASLRAYRQSNGTIGVYLYLAPQSVATVRADGVLDSNTHVEPHPAQVAPSGTLSYDSSQPATYPDGNQYAQRFLSRYNEPVYFGTAGGSSSQSVYFESNGTPVESIASTGTNYTHAPVADNTVQLGTSSNAYQQVAAHAVYDVALPGAAAIYTDAGGQLHSAGESQAASSATPAFSATSTVNTITLSANVISSTLAAGTAGFRTTFVICQPSTGGPYTFVWPPNVRGGMAIGATASTCSAQDFVYSSVLSAWVAASQGVANE